MHAVQRTARRLAEICRQQDQGNGHEQREYRAAPPNLLVMHEMGISKDLSARRRGHEPNTVGSDYVNSCSNGGSLRIPPTIVPIPQPRKSAVTPPGERASASRDAAAPRYPAAA